MTLTVRSSAFQDGGIIPRQCTCDGENLAPPLDWSGVPSQSKSVALICDDPDAPSGTFTHWVLYNIPPAVHSLDARTPVATEGVNGFGKIGFGGPCPPKKDPAHHYHFHVYALDVDSLGPAGLSAEDVRKAVNGHVIAEGELVGTYKRAS